MFVLQWNNSRILKTFLQLSTLKKKKVKKINKWLKQMSSGYGNGEHTTPPRSKLSRGNEKNSSARIWTVLSETTGYEKAHWLVFSVCKPQAKHYLQVTEIAIKCPDVTTKPSNYTLPVRELTSLCPQLTVSDILWFNNRTITTRVGGEGKYQQKRHHLFNYC